MRLLALLSLTLACYGYQQNQPPRRTVTGTVTNAVSGEPIRHALVQVSNIPSASALTGSDGRFEIDNVPEGPANFSVTKPGFFDSRSLSGSQWRTPGPMFTVGSGKNDFRLTLFPAARITGHLTNSEGEPVEQITVQVLAEQIVNGHKQWQARNGSNSDDDGSYHIEDLLPGRYIVLANAHALVGPAWDAPPEVIAPVYYPKARDLASAQIIDVRPGETFRADFHLRPERGYRITGHLSGIPAGWGVALLLQDSGGQTVYLGGQKVDTVRQSFVVQTVPSGTWTFIVGANDAEGHSYEARQQVTVSGADINNLEIQLHPGASIPITMNHAANQTQPRSQSPFPQSSDEPGVNPVLISADGPMLRTYTMTPHEDPSVLSFDNVAEGKYKLDVQSLGTECLESAWYGNVNLSEDYLVVGPGGATQPLIINVRGDCASLRAKIAPGQNQASGFLVIVPSSSFAEPKVWPIMAQSSSPAGAPFYGMSSFYVASATLSPGDYRVFAFTSLDGLEYANPDALRDYPSQSINLDPGQKLELTVKLTDRKGN